MALADPSATTVDARDPGRMAGRQARHSLPSHRSAENRPGRGDRHDVDRVRRALPHPAGRGGQGRADRCDQRAVRARVGRRARVDPASQGQAGLRQPAGYPSLHRRVLHSCPLDEEGAARRNAATRSRAISSSWSSLASTASSTPTISTSSTSSTGCGNTRSSSARRISTSSHGATRASCASASTVSCIRSTRSRIRC